ncbi:MAG TPA: hypothetical protein VIT91_20955 [Chthoniobacterales bacterium]
MTSETNTVEFDASAPKTKITIELSEDVAAKLRVICDAMGWTLEECVNDLFKGEIAGWEGRWTDWLSGYQFGDLADLKRAYRLLTELGGRDKGVRFEQSASGSWSIGDRKRTRDGQVFVDQAPLEIAKAA